ncbi:MAG: FMN-binding glutamate synthase family protein [Alphaproteobacteria bacterium]|nr:FMN-binding glutamate synthase family protein [Alphaproteobacteria bacterium]
MRYSPFAIVLALSVCSLALGLAGHDAGFWSLALLAPLVLVGIFDIVQTRHTLWRLFPIAAHVRWFFEWLRPFMREYLLDGDHQGRPFSHRARALVYKRAKDLESAQPFGTDLDVYSSGYEWINHAVMARQDEVEDHRVAVGEGGCRKPYSASLLNISAMSFGALSGRAIEALNLGAKLGGFYHDTGEGGLSRYHLAHGGDVVWELGTGYFGCRTPEGGFDRARFRDGAAHDQVKMIEIKLSQGAKPGHGGLLPGAKVSPEIAAARGVEAWADCLSPAHHSAFGTPVGLMEWIAELRELSGGKPVGFKLCVGHTWEVLALVKAMLKTGIAPDFIVVDGAEGGTGAAPAELSNHVGTPLREGLVTVVNALAGTGLRRRVRIAAAGKITTGHMLAANLALGADWCNAARAFMFALGCVQTKRCHTGTCPTGIATQDKWRQWGLDVADKGPRVHHFHRNTMLALSQYVGAAGLESPAELRPHHLRVRVNENLVLHADELYRFLAPGCLLDAPQETPYGDWWAMADADSFAPRRLETAARSRAQLSA